MVLRLALNSPVGFEPAEYNWPIVNYEKSDGGALEIIDTIRWVCIDFPELCDYFDKNSLIDYDPRSYESMKLACDKYNAAIGHLLQRTSNLTRKMRSSTGLLRHIIQQAYNQAVTDPDRLNQYEPFSPEVYGETSFEFIAQMIEQIEIKSNDVFIDLGSGVGQVVLQVAAASSAKLCLGIEKADVPSNYAEGMDFAFKFWMNWYGKEFSPYKIIKGDFFNDDHREIINNATFIFVNNFAFGPNVDHMLKLRFADLKDGARIVSSKAFCPLNFRITDRNLSDIGTIMHVREIQPVRKGSVSWTGKSVSYYLHEIDRTKLENYFLNMRHMKKKDLENVKMKKNGRVNGSNGSLSADSSSDDSKSKDETAVCFGPTTRKAWSEWCNSRTSNSFQQPENNNNNNSNNNQHSNSNNNNANNGSKISSEKTSSNDGYQSEPIKSNRVGRPRKYSPGVTAVVRRAKKKPLSVKNSSLKRPGRPRKVHKKHKNSVNYNGLNLLHAQTILSTSINAGIRSEPAPGCIDQRLNTMSIDLQNVNINNGNNNNINQFTPSSFNPVNVSKPVDMKLVTQNVEHYLDRVKYQFLSFINHMQTPDYRNTLVTEIEAEKCRRLMLQSQIDMLEKVVKSLLEKGVDLLKQRLADLGIKASSADELVNKAKEILIRNKGLQEQINQLQDQVAYIEDVNNHLQKINLAKAQQKQQQQQQHELNHLVKSAARESQLVDEKIDVSKLTGNKTALTAPGNDNRLQMKNVLNNNKSKLMKNQENVIVNTNANGVHTNNGNNGSNCKKKAIPLEIIEELTSALERRRKLMETVQHLETGVDLLEKASTIGQAKLQTIDRKEKIALNESPIVNIQSKCNTNAINANFTSNDVNGKLDLPKLPNIEDRIANCIVAALNDNSIKLSDSKRTKQEAKNSKKKNLKSHILQINATQLGQQQQQIREQQQQKFQFEHQQQHKQQAKQQVMSNEVVNVNNNNHSDNHNENNTAKYRNSPSETMNKSDANKSRQISSDDSKEKNDDIWIATLPTSSSTSTSTPATTTTNQGKCSSSSASSTPNSNHHHHHHSKKSPSSEYNISYSQEEHKPLLLTFKKDHRDNSYSTSVRSPSKSPEKSPRNMDANHKRKHSLSPERHKKSRSPKQVTVVDGYDNERKSLVIKFNYSQSQLTSHSLLNANENDTFTLPNEGNSANHHGKLTGKWHERINSRFDKLIALASND